MAVSAKQKQLGFIGHGSKSDDLLTIFQTDTLHTQCTNQLGSKSNSTTATCGDQHIYSTFHNARSSRRPIKHHIQHLETRPQLIAKQVRRQRAHVTLHARKSYIAGLRYNQRTANIFISL